MEANPNPNLSPAVCHQPSLLGGAENMKLLFDSVMNLQTQKLMDGQSDARAWDTLKLRISNNAATVDHLANLGLVAAGQAGVTEAQQTVSPVRTGAADNLASGSTPANRVVDETGAVAAGAVNSATAQAVLGNVTAQIADLTTQVAALAALIAQVVTNAGTAAKP